MKRMSKLLIGLTLLLTLSLSFISCKHDVGPTSKKVYQASEDISNYAKHTVYRLEGRLVNKDDEPEVFIVTAEDLRNTNGKLTNEDLVLMGKTYFSGGTIIVDAPTNEDLIAIGLVFGNLSVLDDEIIDVMDESPWTLDDLFEAIAASVSSEIPVEEGINYIKSKKYEAIALKQNAIYYIHDINEKIAMIEEIEDLDSETEETSFEENEEPEDLDLLLAKENPEDAAIDPTDYNELLTTSVMNFVSWINLSEEEFIDRKTLTSEGKRLLQEKAGDRAANLNQIINAKPIHHNFTAVFNVEKKAFYDGRYNGKKENVEVSSYVWSACDIENSTDYYIVRTTVSCHNNELGYSADDKNKYYGPYYDNCKIDTTIRGANSLLTDQCSPVNKSGSTTVTSGISKMFNGNIGLSASGPNAGLTGGATFSESKSRTIDDISVNFETTSDKHAKWIFQASPVMAYKKFLFLKCDGAKSIQKNLVTFDTYSIYTTPSSYEAGNQTVELSNYIQVRLACASPYIKRKSMIRYVACTKWFYNNNSILFTDRIQKPCNIYKEYIMTFTPPEGMSNEDVDRLHTLVKTYISDWGDKVNYYAVGESRLDGVAKTHFAAAKKKINTNKNVLQSRGFKGKFTFYIQRVDTGTMVDSFEIEF